MVIHKGGGRVGDCPDYAAICSGAQPLRRRARQRYPGVSSGSRDAFLLATRLGDIQPGTHYRLGPHHPILLDTLCTQRVAPRSLGTDGGLVDACTYLKPQCQPLPLRASARTRVGYCHVSAAMRATPEPARKSMRRKHSIHSG